MEQARRGSRRKHSDELKAEVLAECSEPGASVAEVALKHGLNANLVHKWRRSADRGSPSTRPSARKFVPIALSPVLPAPSATADIRIDLRRGPTSITVSWPIAAADECASWIRELLR